ncbi:hypothetical protein EJD97_012688 [Solanum chilense]|uniref:Uncharacterized protein n=1 Tax=Solanum chilense TaxID=4083 RepID=A0A6N2AHA5_SOLCI|nr:hypothetical protein EJD97_012688 [Solanum chilense]
MTTCIILHNMKTDNQRDSNAQIRDVVEASTLRTKTVLDENLWFKQLLTRQKKKIKDKTAHFELPNAL